MFPELKEETKMNSIDKVGIVIYFILMPIAIIVTGLLLSVFWGWFLVPIGLPAIGIAPSLGISLVIGMMTNHNIPFKDHELDVMQAISSLFVKPIMYLILSLIYVAYL